MYDYEKERLEAVSAGQRALDSLNLAKNELNSAKNWGIVDLIGGGFSLHYASVPRWIRHNRIWMMPKVILNGSRRN